MRMKKRRKRAALLAALAVVLALNAGSLTAAAEESQDSEGPVILQTTAKEVTILDPGEAQGIPAGLREVTAYVDDRKAGGWTEDSGEEPEFVIFYGRMDGGEADFYQYDLVEKTVQRYKAPTAAVTADVYLKLEVKYNQLLNDYNDLSRENIMFKAMTAAAVLAAIF